MNTHTHTHTWLNEGVSESFAHLETRLEHDLNMRGHIKVPLCACVCVFVSVMSVLKSDIAWMLQLDVLQSRCPSRPGVCVGLAHQVLPVGLLCQLAFLAPFDHCLVRGLA